MVVGGIERAESVGKIGCGGHSAQCWDVTDGRRRFEGPYQSHTNIINHEGRMHVPKEMMIPSILQNRHQEAENICPLQQPSVT